MSVFSPYFERDGYAGLLARLKKHVVLTALKQINDVYSCIRLNDLRRKLKIDSIGETQGIVSTVRTVTSDEQHLSTHTSLAGHMRWRAECDN